MPRVRFDLPIKLIIAPISGQWWAICWSEVDGVGKLIRRISIISERKRRPKRRKGKGK